jgi:hypothetical protein
MTEAEREGLLSTGVAAQGMVLENEPSAADRRRAVIDVPALCKRALHDYIKHEQRPKGASGQPRAGFGPPWTVPTHCPNCGAPVDQARASRDRDPLCDFCHQPVPVTPAR